MVGADIEGSAPDAVAVALAEERIVINATGPNTLRFVPPLVINDAQIDDAIERLARVIA